MPDKALENVLQNLDGREIARCHVVRQTGVTLYYVNADARYVSYL